MIINLNFKRKIFYYLNNLKNKKDELELELELRRRQNVKVKVQNHLL